LEHGNQIQFATRKDAPLRSAQTEDFVKAPKNQQSENELAEQPDLPEAAINHPERPLDADAPEGGHKQEVESSPQIHN